MIKSHTTVGYNILSESSGLQVIAKIVRHHHEWWNGEGYPDGVRQMNIPYLSQILGVCDAVSAMSVDRSYKKAMSEEQILGELKKGFGKQFSPKVAKVMMEYITDGHFKRFLLRNRKM